MSDEELRKLCEAPYGHPSNRTIKAFAEAIPRLLAEKERLLNALAEIIEATNENHIEDRATSAIRAALEQGGGVDVPEP